MAIRAISIRSESLDNKATQELEKSWKDIDGLLHLRSYFLCQRLLK